MKIMVDRSNIMNASNRLAVPRRALYQRYLVVFVVVFSLLSTNASSTTPPPQHAVVIKPAAAVSTTPHLSATAGHSLLQGDNNSSSANMQQVEEHRTNTTTTLSEEDVQPPSTRKKRRRRRTPSASDQPHGGETPDEQTREGTTSSMTTLVQNTTVIHQGNRRVESSSHHVLVQANKQPFAAGNMVSHDSTSLKNDTTSKRTDLTKNQTVPLNPKNSDDRQTKEAPATKTKKQRTTATGSRGGREGACLRRIKREWRDAVKLGIAYDWANMETVVRSKSQARKKTHEYVRIGPWGKNLLHWHFSVQGPASSVYENGIYHGRVLLPKDYPGSPPRIQVFTPSGRFIPGHDICLSASAFHPESWTPRWTVLSLVDALRLHMLTTANEIGGKDATSDERRRLAKASRTWILRGEVDHGRMVEAGIFPVVAAEEPRNEERRGAEEKEATESTTENSVCPQRHHASVSQTVAVEARPVAARKRLARHHAPKLMSIVLQAVVKVLTSPTRLAIFALLVFFAFLNRR